MAGTDSLRSDKAKSTQSQVTSTSCQLPNIAKKYRQGCTFWFDVHFCKYSSPQKNLIRPNYPNPRLFSESFIEENVCLFPTTIPNVNGSKNYLRFQIQLYFFNTLFSKVHQVLFKKLPDQNLPQNHLWAFTKSSVEEFTQKLRTAFVNVFLQEINFVSCLQYWIECNSVDRQKSNEPKSAKF